MYSSVLNIGELDKEDIGFVFRKFLVLLILKNIKEYKGKNWKGKFKCLIVGVLLNNRFVSCNNILVGDGSYMWWFYKVSFVEFRCLGGYII